MSISPKSDGTHAAWCCHSWEREVSDEAQNRLERAADVVTMLKAKTPVGDTQDDRLGAEFGLTDTESGEHAMAACRRAMAQSVGRSVVVPERCW